MSAAFTLDPRLAADTVPVVELPLCGVRLMDDARYAWLVLVPRRTGMVEVADLADDEQPVLWHECALAAAALRAVAPCDKLNLGVLGNQVRQLHAHVIARRIGDAAWPGAAWGHGQPEPYTPAARVARCAALAAALGPHAA